MNVVYFDCFSGAGGDMIVASLLDAGADQASVRKALSALRVGGYSLSIERIRKQGFAASRFLVELDRSTVQPHRHLSDIVDILQKADLSDTVRRCAIAVFARLAEAEAAVHGVGVEEVHFHEVGAVDAILDVVGAVSALGSLKAERIVCSPLPVGSGTVACEHGLMPVPAPATAELLRGIPIVPCDRTGELTTPTAAAILTAMADEFGAIPSMTLRAVGYGAGTREDRGLPNLLRVLVGDSTAKAEPDVVVVLETNIDDATPEVIGHCLERLLEEGALDAFAMPIHMKKWRSGILLSAVCPLDRADALEGVIFSETTTFGIRRQEVKRARLTRRHEMVETPFGLIRVKIGEGPGVRTVSPEYDDCVNAARKHGAALRDVIKAAERAWYGKPQT